MIAVCEVDVAEMINDLAIQLFGNPLVKTSITRFHVEDWNLQTLGDNRGQATIRIPQQEQSIRPFYHHDVVGSC